MGKLHRRYYKLARGTCSVCLKDSSINQDKLITPHGPVKNRCSGSYKPPQGHEFPAEYLSALTLDTPLTALQRRHAIAEFARFMRVNEGVEVNHRMVAAVESALSALNP